jgi:hypothetical protein
MSMSDMLDELDELIARRTPTRAAVADAHN